jgi:hypothetical protein
MNSWTCACLRLVRTCWLLMAATSTAAWPIMYANTLRRSEPDRGRMWHNGVTSPRPWLGMPLGRWHFRMSGMFQGLGPSTRSASKQQQYSLQLSSAKLSVLRVETGLHNSASSLYKKIALNSYAMPFMPCHAMPRFATQFPLPLCGTNAEEWPSCSGKYCKLHQPRALANTTHPQAPTND